MKRVTISLIIIACAVFGLRGLILNSETNHVSQDKKDSVQIDQIVNETQSSLSKKAPIKDVAEKEDHVDQSKKVLPADFDENYIEQLKVIGGLIEKHNLSGDELNTLASNLSEEEFLIHLPEELASEYRKLHKMARDKAQKELESLPFGPRKLTKYKVTTPEWIQNRKKQLEQVVLPGHVEEMVEKISKSTSVGQSNLISILENCGQGNKDCIEKSITLLIDANHALTKEQHKMIRDYLEGES